GLGPVQQSDREGGKRTLTRAWWSNRWPSLRKMLIHLQYYMSRSRTGLLVFVLDLAIVQRLESISGPVASLPDGWAKKTEWGLPLPSQPHEVPARKYAF